MAPEQLRDWSLTPKAAAELDLARAVLTTALIERKGGAAAAGAEAQVMFDCWLARTEQGTGGDRAGGCRTRFWEAIGGMQSAGASE